MDKKSILLLLCLWIPTFFAFSQVGDYLRSGNAQLESKKYLEAIIDFSEAIRVAPNTPQAYHGRAMAHHKLQNHQKALNDIQQAIDLDKQQANYFTRKALILLDLKSYEKAIQNLSQAIFLSPAIAENYAYRAKARLALQDYTGTLQDAEKTLQIDSTFSDIYAEQGIALAWLGHKKEAQLCFDTYLEKKNSSENYASLAEKTLKLATNNANLLQNAENWALKAVQQQDNYKHNFIYASILLAENKKLNALEVFQKAISLAKKENMDYGEAEKILEKLKETDVDDIPPIVSLVSPTATKGKILVSREDELTLIGRASDESGIKEVFINGNPARVFPNGDFSGIILIKKETKQILIEVSDQKGNTEKVQFGVIWQEENNTKEKRFKSIGKSYALIFATDEYEYWNNLFNPLADAKAIAKDLEEIYGYEIDVVQNPTQNQIILKLKEYLQKKFENNDQLLIFFAGHGQFDETFGEGYVVAKDSRLDDEAKSSYLSHATLRTYINNIQCKHILLVMDVCFGGTFDPQLAAKSIRGTPPTKLNDEELEKFIQRKMQSKTRRYITSGGKEYVSDGSPGMHSPFVRKFLEALRSYGGKDNIMTISEILTYLEIITPQVHFGEFGHNEPGSDFLLISK